MGNLKHIFKGKFKYDIKDDIEDNLKDNNNNYNFQTKQLGWDLILISLFILSFAIILIIMSETILEHTWLKERCLCDLC